MADETAPLSTAASGAEPDRDDSNLSSPLSEVDDKAANDGDIEHMQLDGEARSDSSLTGDEDNQDPAHGSDSESALSDARSDVNSEANDTEAETERLYDTPQSKRQRDVVVDQFNDGQVYERTPSKLRSAAAAAKDDDSLSGDDASVHLSRAASEAPPETDGAEPGASRKARRAEPERKRKRSLGSEQSDSDQPLRKRSSQHADGDVTNGDEPFTELPSGEQSIGEGDESPTKGDAKQETERATRKNTRSRSKRNAPEEEDGQESLSREETRDEVEDDAENQEGEDVEAEVEDEAEAAAKNQEELERKQVAFKDWRHIEEMFIIFRERLYKDRLQRLEDEEQSLLADVPTHPEYLNMKQCLDERFERKVREFDTELKFRLEANSRRAVAQKSQAWSQYFQAVREKREQSLEKLNKEWYDIQSARRRAHSMPDYGLLFPQDPVDRVRNAIAYNTEVSTLAGMAKYRGFPAGPEIKGASASEIEDDLAAMNRSRNMRQRPMAQPREEFQTPSFARLGPAGQQFIKDTPWANPDHSSHLQRTYSSTPTQAPQAPAPPPQELSYPGPSAGMAGPPGPKPGRKALPTGPGLSSDPARHRSPALGRLSESPDMTRSMLNPGPKGLGPLSVGRGSKTAAV